MSFDANPTAPQVSKPNNEPEKDTTPLSSSNEAAGSSPAAAVDSAAVTVTPATPPVEDNPATPTQNTPATPTQLTPAAADRAQSENIATNETAMEETTSAAVMAESSVGDKRKFDEIRPEVASTSSVEDKDDVEMEQVEESRDKVSCFCATV